MNYSITVAPRNHPNVSSKSVLLTLEPFQRSIDTISKMLATTRL